MTIEIKLNSNQFWRDDGCAILLEVILLNVVAPPGTSRQVHYVQNKVLIEAI
jgi:hypothetical protein